MIFGQFIEHFDNQVYGGIYDPGSKYSDNDGFRMDVIEALKEIKTPIVRWPGGCFVSTYHWMDGIGSKRTPVYDKTWQVEDPNTLVQMSLLLGVERWALNLIFVQMPEQVRQKK